MTVGVRGLSLEERLARLEDERAILHTLYTYGHGIDYDLEEEFLDCWTEDAVLYWPDRPPIAGHDALANAFRAHPPARRVFQNHVIVDRGVEVEWGRATVDFPFARLDD